MVGLNRPTSNSEPLATVKKISKKFKEKHETARHRVEWLQTVNNLDRERQKCQIELNSIYDTYLKGDGVLQGFGKNIKQYKSFLDEEFQNFKIALIDPVWVLRNEIQKLILNNKKHSQYLTINKPIRFIKPTKEEYHQLLHTSHFFLDNLSQILLHLDTQQKDLEKELRKNVFWNEEGCVDDKEFTKFEGIPEEAQNLLCPDKNLRDLTLMEFYLLDIKYKERLRTLREKYQNIAQIFLTNPSFSWSKEDHLKFKSIYEKQMYCMPVKDRGVFFDELRIHFPHKTRAELVTHEALWTSHVIYKKCYAGFPIEWQKDKNELLCKIKVIFLEACMIHDLKEVDTLNELEQNKLCQELYEKVIKWRCQKFMILQQQDELDEKKHEQAEEHRKNEVEKELGRSCEEKYKISVFHNELKIQDENILQKMEQSLQEMKKQLSDESQYDKKCIKMRSTLLMMKQDQLQRQQQIQGKLKLPVKKPTYKELNRTCKKKGSLAKVRNDTNEIVNMDDEPLFKVFNFMTNNTLLVDHKLIFEQKLRETGLISSPYARQILKKLSPFHPPLPEQKSCISKN